MPTVYRDGKSKYVSNTELPYAERAGWSTRMPMPRYAEIRTSRTAPPTPAAQTVLDLGREAGLFPSPSDSRMSGGGVRTYPSPSFTPTRNTVDMDAFNKQKALIEANRALWWLTDEDENILIDDNGKALQKPMGQTWLENMQAEEGWSDATLSAIVSWYGQQAGDVPFDTGIDTSGGYSGGYGGGGGGGYAGPIYVSPDRRTIEDAMKAQLYALTGTADESRIQSLTDSYLKAHKQSWEIRQAGGEDVDPNQTTLDMIRSQADYKQIHKLRPESEDEMRWLSDRRNRLEQLGVDAKDAEERSITMAQIGASPYKIETGGFQYSKGRKDITLFRQLQQSASAIAGAL